MGSANALIIPEKWLRATDKQKEGRRKKSQNLLDRITLCAVWTEWIN